MSPGIKIFCLQSCFEETMCATVALFLALALVSYAVLAVSVANSNYVTILK